MHSEEKMDFDFARYSQEEEYEPMVGLCNASSFYPDF